MAAIVDQAGDLDLDVFAEGVKKALPTYARPVFVRILHQVEMTGIYLYSSHYTVPYKV